MRSSAVPSNQHNPHPTPSFRQTYHIPTIIPKSLPSRHQILTINPRRILLLLVLVPVITAEVVFRRDHAFGDDPLGMGDHFVGRDVDGFDVGGERVGFAPCEESLGACAAPCWCRVQGEHVLDVGVFMAEG